MPDVKPGWGARAARNRKAGRADRPACSALGMRFYTGNMFPAALSQRDLHRPPRLLEPDRQDRRRHHRGEAQPQRQREVLGAVLDRVPAGQRLYRAPGRRRSDERWPRCWSPTTMPARSTASATTIAAWLDAECLRHLARRKSPGRGAASARDRPPLGWKTDGGQGAKYRTLNLEKADRARPADTHGPKRQPRSAFARRRIAHDIVVTRAGPRARRNLGTLLLASWPAAAQQPAAPLPGRMANARSLTLGDKGTVFVGTRLQDKVYAIVDKDGKREVKMIASGLYRPNGVAFKDGTLYIAELSKISKIEKIEDNLDNPPKPTVIYDDLPKDEAHGWKFIGIGPTTSSTFRSARPATTAMPPEGMRRSAASTSTAAARRRSRGACATPSASTGIRNRSSSTSPTTAATGCRRTCPRTSSTASPRSASISASPFCHQGNILDPEFGWGKSRRVRAAGRPAGPALGRAGHAVLHRQHVPGEVQERASSSPATAPGTATKKIGGDVVIVKLNKDGTVKSIEPFLTGFLEENNVYRPSGRRAGHEGRLAARLRRLERRGLPRDLRQAEGGGEATLIPSLRAKRSKSIPPLAGGMLSTLHHTDEKGVAAAGAAIARRSWLRCALSASGETIEHASRLSRLPRRERPVRDRETPSLGGQQAPTR